MKKTLSLSFVLLAILALGVGAHAFAQAADVSVNVHTERSQGRDPMNKKSGVMGTVTAVSGNTITVTGSNTTTYTIDATSATFLKGFGKKATTATISSIAVGDRIVVQGILTGNSLVATKIIDVGIAAQKQQDGNHVSGKVSAISGNTITVTERDNTTYTIDASAATVTKGFGDTSTASSVGAIAVGDFISVTSSSTISGTSVTASAITDMGTQMMRGGMMSNGNHLFGIISAINGSNITIAMRAPGQESGAVNPNIPTLVTTSATTVTDAGKASALTNLAVGQMIIADGTLDASAKTFTATSIRIVNAGASNELHNQSPVQQHGFLQGIGNFFRGMFR